MINCHEQLVSALENILPTHYEMALTSKTKTPCFSYMETNNYAITDAQGANLGYSRVVYQVKVWGHSITDLVRYAAEADKALRPLGFKRIASGELYDNSSTMKQKILTYEALALEEF